MNIQELPEHQQRAASLVLADEFVMNNQKLTQNQKQAYYKWLQIHPEAYKIQLTHHYFEESKFIFSYETPTEHITVIFKP